MENRGLADFLSDVFGGVSKILTGKEVPSNDLGFIYIMFAGEIIRAIISAADRVI